MKKIIIFTILMNLMTSAYADVSNACYKNAEQAVMEQSERTNYDNGGIEAYECDLAPNKAVIICEVSASKGGGAATDSYRVVLNKSCSKVFRVDLVGEE